MIASHWLRMFSSRLRRSAWRRRILDRRGVRRSFGGLGRRALALEVRILPAAIVDPNPSPGNGFGNSWATLNNGNVVVTAPYDDAGGTDAGAVYLFDGTTGAVISTLIGSQNYDNVGDGGVWVLPDASGGADNYVILSSNWDNAAAWNAGAVTWGSGVSGVNGQVSAANSLVGSTADDIVGAYGIDVLINETGRANYVVKSVAWDNGSAMEAGAVTWGSGATGISGAVSASNSLVGMHSWDLVGNQGVTIVTNNGIQNYVVNSPSWDNGSAVDAGAVTWGSGLSGVAGEIDGTNSLVGVANYDHVGSNGVWVVGTNGSANYVIRSLYWANGTATAAGAVTWVDGSVGLTGTINASNSLVGTRAYDFIGERGIDILWTGTGSHFVIASPSWDNGNVVDAGAVTWVNGDTGLFGTIDETNSLVGTSLFDRIGSSGVETLWSSSGAYNYVVPNPDWDNGAVANVGAVTWGSGLTGVAGPISSSNSVIGSSANDQLGSSGIWQISGVTGANYLFASQWWDNGAATNAGAVTWGSGESGLTGVLGAANSLVGSSTNDRIGKNGIQIDYNSVVGSFYVVDSPQWDNGAAVDAGAFTWGSGSAGVSGAVSASNSVVGSSTNDLIGKNYMTIQGQTGSSYLLTSSGWDNGAAADAGAVTFVNGGTGLVGEVSASNSLVGETENDRIGSGGIRLLRNNVWSFDTSYLVVSPDWDNGDAVDAGAVTWASGSAGVFGAVSESNSLVGSSSDDRVGSRVEVVDSFNSQSYYLVSTPNWDDGDAVDAGAVTWASTAAGVSGAIDSKNSLIGSTDGDQVGSDIQLLYTGDGFDYVVISPHWSNGTAANAGAVTRGIAAGGVSGRISDLNSLVGSSEDDQVGSGGVQASFHPYANTYQLVVLSPNWNNGAATGAGAVSFGDSEHGVIGTVGPGNSVIGTSQDDHVGSYGVFFLDAGFGFYNFAIISPDWDNGAIADAGAVTWVSGNPKHFTGEVSSDNSLVGSSANDAVGSGGVYLVDSEINYYSNYVVVSPNWDNGDIIDAGAATWATGTDGITGEISATNSLVGSTDSDHVGSGGVRTFYDYIDGGVNYFVVSPSWDNGALVDVGAIVWGNGETGVFGPVAGANRAQGRIASSGDSMWLNSLNDYSVEARFPAEGRTVYGTASAGFIGDSPFDVLLSNSTVSEDAAYGTLVGTLSAKDSDLNETFSYSLVYWTETGSIYYDGFSFQIDGDQLKTASGFNAEVQSIFTIRVQVTDSSGSTYQRTLTIQIEDVDEADVTTPVDIDGPTGASVAEDLAVGAAVGITAQASDADATHNAVTYTLTSNPGGLFAIHPTTGVVTLAAGLNYETGTSHTITVQAESSDGSKASRSFTITVSDVDEADVTTPVDLEGEEGATVPEDLTVGSDVGIKAFAQDLDGTHNSVTYSLTSNPGSLFEINAGTGVVRLGNEPLNFELLPHSITITVTATSSDGSTASKDFTITITDVDEADVTTPVDIDGETGASVAEDLAVGSAVGITAQASDADGGNNSVTYTLVSNPDGLFAIHPTTGVVTLAAALNFEIAALHTITVQAESSDGSKSSQDFTIAVTDVDEYDVSPIVDKDDGRESVSENAAAGTLVGIMARALDGDGTDFVTYSLTDDAGGRFQIDPESGVVTVAVGAVLDFEAATSHDITVLATSSDGSTSSETFTIAVTDVVETPSLRLDDSTIAENQPAGAVVGSFFVAGAAQGAATYKFVNGRGFDNGRFKIVGNQLVTKGSFNFESKSTYSVRVQVRTASGFTETKVFTISVEDVNEKPTALTLSGRSIPENSAVGTAVGTFSGRDPDAGSTLTYSLVPIPGQSDHEKFTIENGVLKTAAVFDYETKSSYAVRVRVTDQGGSSYERTFTISVRNVNEPPLLLTLSQTTVMENQRAGTTVGSFGVIDPDGATPYQYSLVSGDGSTDNAKFRIVKGALVTNMEFDFEHQSTFSIRVRVTDKGGASYEQVFVISVLDAAG